MDFSLTDEQAMLRDTARGLLAKECPPALVRAGLEDPHAGDALWTQHLRGWVTLAGESLVDLCLFLEELGAAVAPGPYFATAALFVPLLQAIDHPLAAAALEGEVTGTVALAGADGWWVPSDDDRRTFVPSLDLVDHVAFVVGDGGGGDGDVRVVVRGADTVTSRRVDTLDLTRSFFTVDVPSDVLDAHPSVDDVVLDRTHLDDVVERATVALAAEMIGTSRWLVDASVAYARERVQFDKPIGAFQAVQHQLVDLSLDHERALAAVYYAAMAIDAGDADRHRAVHVAKAAAGRAVTHAAKGAMQVHAGIGYTWEHDLHLYLRRGYTNEHLLGPSAWHHDRLAELLLG